MLSGHLALINAARRLERNQLDFAVAGAFSAHSEPVHHSMFEHLGLARRVVSVDSTVTENSGERMTIADGSVFVALERRGDAVTHGRNSTLAYLGGAHMSDAQGPLAPDLDAPCIERAIFAAMEKAKVSASDVGLILTGAMGLKSIDSAELEGISRVFARVQAKPALGECCGFFGNLMEAGGLAELGLLPLLFKNQDLPSVLRSEAAQASGYATVIDTNKKTALVLRNSPWGEASCLVLRIGESIKIPLSN
jgi:3-oxoacyl-(acyl-carrier-protein) synthase